VFSVILIGIFTGPIQPLAIEVAVECSYPSSEAGVTAVQQLAGNFLSAILTPILNSAKDPNTESMMKSNWIITALVGLVGFFYIGWNGEYRRMKLDFNVQEIVVSTPNNSVTPTVPELHDTNFSENTNSDHANSNDNNSS